MTTECLGETGMSLKDQIDHSQKGSKDKRCHTQRGILQTGKCFKWLEDLVCHFYSDQSSGLWW